MGRTNFFYLLGALLILLFTIPVADDLNVVSAPLVRGVLFSILLLAGIWSLRGGGVFFTFGMVFVIAGLVLNIIAVDFELAIFQYGSIFSLIGFLLITIVFSLKQVVFSAEINVNRLVGAVCIFLMLGVLWALTYSVLELMLPGSFTGLSSAQKAGWDSSWLYFSFVTLTTLGYGDILPVSAIARSLAYMQAVTGQFYVAVLVAGLVSAYISEQKGS